MILLVTGGSGSGKSAYAEERACALHRQEEGGRLLYIATMEPYGEEGKRRIERHRKQRAGRGFLTRECYTHLEELSVRPEDTALLECLSNLAANEMFSPKGRHEHASQWVCKGILHLAESCRNVVLVGNQVFSDGEEYEASTMEYLDHLAQIQNQASAIAQEVVEVVCGIPVVAKSAEASHFGAAPEKEPEASHFSAALGKRSEKLV